jgi:hypothetical protein
MTSSTNMAPISIGGHTRWNSLSRGTGSSCADDAGTEGPIFDVRRRELVTLFGGGLAAMPDDYFIGPQLGRPRPWPIELDRDPTVSERALIRSRNPLLSCTEVGAFSPLNSDY